MIEYISSITYDKWYLTQLIIKANAVRANFLLMVSTYWTTSRFPGFGSGNASQVSVGSFFNVSYPLVGFCYYILLYSIALTPQQILQNHNYVSLQLSARGISLGTTPTSGRLLVCFGDSITRGVGSSVIGGHCGWPSEVLPQLNHTYNLVNLGIGGYSAGLVKSLVGASAGSVLADAPNQQNCCVVMTGTNDNFSVDAYNSLISTCAILKSLSNAPKVVVVTGLPRYANDTARLNFNSNIRSQTSPPWDVIADWGSDSLMGQSGQYSNTTYYADGIHPNDTGYAIGAGYIKNAINSLN